MNEPLAGLDVKRNAFPSSISLLSSIPVACQCSELLIVRALFCILMIVSQSNIAGQHCHAPSLSLYPAPKVTISQTNGSRCISARENVSGIKRETESGPGSVFKRLGMLGFVFTTGLFPMSALVVLLARSLHTLTA